MRRIRFAVTVAFALVAAGRSVAPPAPAEPELSARLDRAIANKVADMGVPGAIVAVSVPGVIDYQTAIGVTDTATGGPQSLHDHTRIGSVTKTFTGTAVLQLVDQGRISLSDPISRYVGGVPDGDAITLDMLGRMRSGLPFGEYLRQNIFAPAGLSRTSYPDNGALPGPHTHGYVELPDGPVVDATFWNPSWADAAGKIVSTTADLGRWARTLGTGALLRPETQALRWPPPALPRRVRAMRSRSSTPTGGSATTVISPASRPCWSICRNKMRRCRFRSTPMSPRTTRPDRSPRP